MDKAFNRNYSIDECKNQIAGGKLSYKDLTKCYQNNILQNNCYVFFPYH